MKKKIFNLEKYGMVICPCCQSQGYLENPKRLCCPQRRGFGFIKEEGKNTNIEVEAIKIRTGDEAKSDLHGEDCKQLQECDL